MANDSTPDGVGVYDRPKTADRPPIWAFVLLFLILAASGVVTYFVWPF